MHNICSDEEINTPSPMYKYLSSNTDNAAWMAHYEGIDGIIWAQLANELVPGITMGILSDIVLDRNNPPTAIKGDAYHEFTHASHFTNVGVLWYNHLTYTEFMAGVHGNGTKPGAGYVAVAESWAEHIGDSFDGGNNEDLFQEPGSPHVPEGLHWDLWDVVDPLNPERPGVNDNLSGFTNGMMFNTLDENVTSIPQYRERLWNNFHTAPGVMATENNYILLFNSYGY